MNKIVILALILAAAYGAVVTNQVAYQCISEVSVPDQLNFTFTYAVQCNKFHNGLVNASTQKDPVNIDNWKQCQQTLKSVKGVSKSDLSGFINAINNCTTQGSALQSGASTVTNQVAEQCIEHLTIPDELSFAFNYGVDCNKFHNGLVNESTANKPVNVSNWKTCKDILAEHFTDPEAKNFYSAIDQCVSSGKTAETEMASTITNKVAEACVETVTVPSELSFAFNYGVDCNKFHNNLVNESTANKPVNVSNWKTCKDILAEHFTDSEAKNFYSAIDQCVSTGKASLNEQASSVTNQVAEQCIEHLTIPDELQFAFNYGVDCNKFHNGLVNESTANQSVNVSNWNTCKKILAEHFSDSEAKNFYSAIDQCVSTGKTAETEMASTITNKVAEACVETVTVPSELSFAFNYGVDCNKFHNGLVNESTANKPVNVSNWKTCKDILAEHFTDSEAKNFYSAIDQCVSTGKTAETEMASTITNKVAEACVETVTVPSELSFAFNYGVDCNKFHNGLVNESTANKPVNVSNWKTCKDILAEHFTDSEAKNFYSAIDQCVSTGKASLNEQASSVTNQVAEQCIEHLTIPDELQFAFNYGVDCNKFHNGLVNESTANKPVNVSNWKTCKDILAEHFTDSEAKNFYSAIDQCVSTGKTAETEMASTITNKVAEACVETVTVPSELSFAFNYGVDCNKFHNNLVNESTANQPVNVSNWKTCKDILAEHFDDKDAKEFYEDIDSCLASGKKVERYSILRKFKNFIGI
ncbi:hypothetical protein TTHERM_00979870 (macronuclear) [Tetrahymena thermophila SB210]|uniref:Transmembrane protein n=1 Tax=Tetrahymena thermophila (strain SB210) TaxID=312017 RepID=Q23JH0_TETTS|nr:hypothetical protein TTHERM_00979870 [Tetrahymena thermophila SB210]EAR96674.3 hypothetical protein TTHERM_00979870 [Tetrahymena thermophila SB210]|eukprot:XP_001016919.3 hypothetical protein TTHERM_00979870 [Tetrahymena thermophila SB210]